MNARIEEPGSAIWTLDRVQLLIFSHAGRNLMPSTSQSESDLTPSRRMYAAIDRGDASEAKRLLEVHPELLSHGGIGPTWLHDAAGIGDEKTVQMLIDFGLDVNAGGKSRPDGPLSWAVGKGHLEVARLLLQRGANPNVGRLLIAAINCQTNSLALVKLLVEHGADVNRCFPFGGDGNGPMVNALSWANGGNKREILEYLRSHGAVMPDEVPAPAHLHESATAPVDLRQRIIAHFERHFGPVRPQAVREIVPCDPPLLVHAVPPTAARKSLILFTTGMSARPQTVPAGAEAFRYTELMIHLPADWPLTQAALRDPNHAWPIHWLRRIARNPHESNSWLGGLFTIVSNDEPPKRLAPGNHFVAMLLTAEPNADGRIDGGDRMIQLYTLYPLYLEEKRLEEEAGMEELLRRFARFNISNIVDIRRANVALGQ